MRYEDRTQTRGWQPLPDHYRDTGVEPIGVAANLLGKHSVVNVRITYDDGSWHEFRVAPPDVEASYEGTCPNGHMTTGTLSGPSVPDALSMLCPSCLPPEVKGDHRPLVIMGKQL